MAFNTTSFIAGVGSVVVVLSTGFAGGYFIANPAKVDPPNRLQRLAAEDHAVAKTAVKPEVVAAATPAATSPAPVTPAASAPAAPVQQAAVQPEASPAPAAAEIKAPEPAQTVAARETATPTADRPDTEKVVAQKAPDRERAAEAKLAERKHSDTRKVAEQQRKQRELEVATVAVRRIIHERDGQDVIIRDRDAPELVQNDPPEPPAPAMPRFNLFGD